MGLIMSRFYDKLFTRETRVLLLGLDGAGKTTILYKLKLDELVTTIPVSAARRRTPSTCSAQPPLSSRVRRLVFAALLCSADSWLQR